jgi:hypothetical protein
MHAEGRAQMGWVLALVALSAFVMLGLTLWRLVGLTLWRLVGDKGWRDQAEGLRERLEREGLPRA